MIAHTFGGLHNHPTAFELNFFAVAEFIILTPVSVSNKVSPFVIDHDPLVESMKLEAAILPALLLSLEIMREEAYILEHQSTAGHALARC
jgi:hypothetical protein